MTKTITASADCADHSPPSPWALAAAQAGVILVLVAVWMSFRKSTDSTGLAPVVASWTTATERTAQRERIHREVIAPNLLLEVPTVFPAPERLEQRWEQFLQAVLWQADRRPEVFAAVQRRLRLPALPENAGELSREVQRLAMETAFGLFPEELEGEMEVIFANDPDAKQVAMAGAWLARQTASPKQRVRLGEILEERHPDGIADPRLLALHQELHVPRKVLSRATPDPAILLGTPMDGRPVVFSFQRSDRQMTGRAIVRHAGGDFIVNPDGTLFSVPQFALSASGLPGTITNGNTPCGIFEIREIASTRNRAIGPTPTLVLGLPLEYDRSWSEDRYLRLLPGDWKNHWPMKEAWWAGQAGRFEILAHGTAIDPAPWSATVFAGETPSQGCLTCRETWDPGTGHRVFSAQAALAEAYQRAGGAPGYLVVVEWDGGQGPVSPTELEELVRRNRGNRG